MGASWRGDVAIFGGGIAGLWTLARLRAAGYSAILVEQDRLGAAQTLASQGMIHGGQKYSLESLRTAIAKMPAVWEACLEGRGPVDLRTARTLSSFQVMWGRPGFAGNLATFAASRALHGDTELMENPAEWPDVFRQGDGFVGKMYRLKERVLDVKSVLDALRRPYASAVVQGTLEGFDAKVGSTVSGVRIQATTHVYCSGQGNEFWATTLGLPPPATQTRPLKQVLVRTLPYPLYGHGIELGDKPRMTITSHPVDDGYVWYLGGALAELGISLSDAQLIERARIELSELFPTIDWKRLEWAVFSVQRAEAFAGGKLPEGPQLRRRGNAIVAWPTKMTFAPQLASELLQSLKTNRDVPAIPQSDPPLPPAEIGLYPWERPLAWTKADA